MASWYGLPFHGRRSANGEIYDMNKLTAAHRTLPFDTVVRVTNLDNGLQTEVRITDRGPFVEDRVIDLSYAAARAIGMVGTGTARVRLDIVASDATNFSPAPASGNSSPAAAAPQTSSDSVTNRIGPARPVVLPVAGYFTVQVGAFGERANAERLKAQLDGRYRPVLIQDFDGENGRVYRVRVGNLSTEDAARDLALKLRQNEGIRGVVVRQDEIPTRGEHP
ncbi:MAG TPA: septal ring lytic transglycosylase RlpA family protein [Candidatus Acidoferrales bacterium]|nr:septal ring lytic transglycosylase RlpA family protein [Candidatus Acidoferrales bacterium]